MSGLPRGWGEATLGDIAHFVMGQAPPGSASNFDGVGTPFVKAGEFGELRPIIREWTTQPLKFATRDDVLICVVGATAGKINLGEDCAIGRSVAAIRPADGASQQFIYNFLKTKVVHLRQGSVGSAQGVISKDDLGDLALPIPPLAEQKRIVAKLEVLSAKSARARAELTRIETLISRYKQAVLSKAFSGAVDHKELSELVVRIKAGKNLRCEERPPHSDEKGVVKVSAVTWGEFRPDQSKTLPSDFEPDEDTRIKSCDFLFSRANTIDLVGAVVIVGDTPNNLYLSDKILRLEFREPIDKWLLWYLRSPMGREALMNISSGNQLSMRNIGQKSLLSLSIPYADFELRDEIVRRIEAAFAKIDRLAGEAKRVLELVGKLDEAVLAKAFRGELVPQDENDEPASVLLERIRAERAAAPKAKRGRRPSA